MGRLPVVWGVVSVLVVTAAVDGARATSARTGGAEPPADQAYDLPPGEWTGAVFLSGTRHRSGLSAVGQPTEIDERVNSASVGLELTMGDSADSGRVTAGSASVAIHWADTGTFSSSTVEERGTLEVTGDVVRLEASGVLDRTIAVKDSSGNPLPEVSGTKPMDVTWVLELVDASCGQFEYRLAEGSTGGSILSWAIQPPSVTATNGFVITHALSAYALVHAPGGPDFADLAQRVQQLGEIVAQIIADPSGTNVDELVFELAILEDLRSDLIATGTCLNTGQLAFVVEGLTQVQTLISQMIGAILERAGELDLDVLVDVLGLGVRTGVISPGLDGSGHELWAAFGVELDARLFAAVAAGDWDTVVDIAVVAAQYGYDQIALNAAEALSAGEDGG